MLCCITGSKVATAQSKKEVLETGFYQTADQHGYRLPVPGTMDTIAIDTIAICLASDFQEVRSVLDEYGHQPAIQIRLAETARQRFAQASKRNIGKRIAIIAGGRILSAPVVQSEIPGGELTLTGGFTLEETRAIAERMQKEIPRNNDRIRRLMQALAAFDEALIKKDTVKLRVLLTEYFKMKHSNGFTETKKELLLHMRQGFLKYDKIEQLNAATFRFDEELAYVTRKLLVTGSFNGKAFSVKLDVAEDWTWDYKQERWQLKGRQAVKQQE